MSYAIQARRRNTMQARATIPSLNGWRTLAYAADSHAAADELEKARARFDDEQPHVELRTREKNPPAHLHIPAQTVRLGTALDLSTQFRNLRTLWDLEVEGWHMLTDPGAMDAPPGAACLYLVRGELRNQKPLQDTHAVAADTYDRWHDRDAEHIGNIDDLPDLLAVYVGRAMRIGYRSDKWHKAGATVDYDHDFCEGAHVPPQVWADSVELASARALVLTGGDMRITEGGID